MVLEPNAPPTGAAGRHLPAPGRTHPTGGRAEWTARAVRDEIVEIDGIRVTTPLRTMCDLGMTLPRRHAFAAMCSLMKVADFTHDDIRDRLMSGSRAIGGCVSCARSSPLCDRTVRFARGVHLALIWHDTPGLPRSSRSSVRRPGASSTWTLPCPVFATRRVRR